MSEETIPVDVTGEQIPGPRHACAFFDGSEEEYRVLLPFAKSCLRCGDRCFQFVDPRRKGERTRRLEEAGMTVSLAPGGIDLRSWDETYLRGGRFVADEMLELVREIVSGSPRARVWANMGWAFRDTPVAEALIDYEFRLNAVMESSGAVIVCVYEAGRYSSDVALGVLRVHPWIVVDGRLERNPAYVPA